MRIIAILSALTFTWALLFLVITPLVRTLHPVNLLYLIGASGLILLILYPLLPDRPYDPREDDPT